MSNYLTGTNSAKLPRSTLKYCLHKVLDLDTSLRERTASRLGRSLSAIWKTLPTTARKA